MHALPSSQTVPLGAFGFEQSPVLGMHVPATWQASIAVQVMGVPVTQVPERHVSPAVHLSLSSHGLPSSFAGLLHAPVAGSQVPAL